MMRLLYSPSKGWFRIFDVLVGTRLWNSDVVLSDVHGCYQRRFLIGPYNTAKEAAHADR